MSEISIDVRLALPNLKSATDLHRALNDELTETDRIAELRGLLQSAGGDVEDLELKRRLLAFTLTGSTRMPVEKITDCLQQLGAKTGLVVITDDQTDETFTLTWHGTKSASAAQVKRSLAAASKARGKAGKKRKKAKPKPIPEPVMVDLADYPPGGYSVRPNWKSIEKTLRAFARSPYVPHFTTADISRHETLFERLQEAAPAHWPDATISDANNYAGDLALLSSQYVLWMWYHPKPEVIDQPRIYKYLTGLGFQYWNRVFSEFPDAVRDAGPMKLMPGYGMFGGREKLLIEIFFPRQEYPLESDSNSTPSLMMFIKNFCHGAARELDSSFQYFPFHPGQYLFDYIVDAARYLPDIIPPHNRQGWTEAQARQGLTNIFSRIARFDEFNEQSRRRPSTIELVRNVRDHCTSDDTPPQLQELWAEGVAQAEENRRNGIPAHFDSKWVLESMGRNAPKLSEDDLARVYAGWPQVRDPEQ